MLYAHILAAVGRAYHIGMHSTRLAPSRSIVAQRTRLHLAMRIYIDKSHRWFTLLTAAFALYMARRHEGELIISACACTGHSSRMPAASLCDAQFASCGAYITNKSHRRFTLSAAAFRLSAYTVPACAPVASYRHALSGNAPRGISHRLQCHRPPRLLRITLSAPVT